MNASSKITYRLQRVSIAISSYESFELTDSSEMIPLRSSQPASEWKSNRQKQISRK